MELGLELNSERYLTLLTKLIGETEHLQNNPPKFIPQEDKAIKHLLDVLRPYSTKNGGPLILDHVVYAEGRGNLIIGYTPPGANGTVSFIGSHLDVVPADPETWEWDPFKLTIEGDKLYGRGTTDCLGHVALITDMFVQLAEKKPILKREVWAVFIASEESTSIADIGIDGLLKNKKLDKLINGPVYWIDSADSHPCIGTASAAMWKLKAEGHQNHSSLPNKAINSIELAQEAVLYLQKRFYEDYPPHPKEEEYKFETPSTMKPTQICCSSGSITQIPSWTEIKGDIRLTPFYNILDCVAKVETYVNELNQDVMDPLPFRGPCSKYEINKNYQMVKPKLTFDLLSEPLKGIACSTESDGYKHLDAATAQVLGTSVPYSDCGSLPLVGDMQEAGFDIQVTGYGHTHVYHGDNEYCNLSDMQNAMKIFSIILDK